VLGLLAASAAAAAATSRRDAYSPLHPKRVFLQHRHEIGPDGAVQVSRVARRECFQSYPQAAGHTLSIRACAVLSIQAHQSHGKRQGLPVCGSRGAASHALPEPRAGPRRAAACAQDSRWCLGGLDAVPIERVLPPGAALVPTSARDWQAQPRAAPPRCPQRHAAWPAGSLSLAVAACA